MGKTIFFGLMTIFGLLLLVGAGLQLINPTQVSAATEPLATPQAQAQVVVEEATDEPQPTETPAPTPTPDTTAIDAANRNLEAAEKNLEAARTQQQTELEKSASAERLKDKDIRLQELKNQEDAAENERLRLENERLELLNEEARLKVAADRVVYETGIAFSVLAGVLLLGAALIIRALRPVSVGARTADGQDHDLPAYPGGMDIRKFVPSIPPEVLLAVARAYVAGVPFTYDKMTPAIISKGRFATLQHLLVMHEGARWLDVERHQVGCEVLPKGEKFFADLVAQTTPPQHPPAGFSQLPGRANRIDRTGQDKNPGGEVVA